MINENHLISDIAKFLDKRIYELSYRKSQRDIAREIGFVNDNVIAMLKSGRTKVPLYRVVSIAKALETDPRQLFVLALTQHGNEKDREAFQGNGGRVLRKRAGDHWRYPQVLKQNGSEAIGRV
ncbi:transcriptional regulator [Mesorhizobium sp. L48C026A00]|uniref:transcriptional regulator n=1 Tax=Mesorhizobium sp. L48C026A00 TaxID=1287182 RepID=UPI0003D0448A|nr:transcriptional regulator [Mesorhizobium sp. L48C026A00]ESZ11919.1 hypothetical protein X737_29035 [Mesorhizobium sp. L48C026A00]